MQVFFILWYQNCNYNTVATLQKDNLLKYKKIIPAQLK